MRPLSFLLVLAALGQGAVMADDLDAPPINYSSTAPDNLVSRLQARLTSGKATLDHEPRTGYLRSLLRELSVPESSQTLVFSKTSFQRGRISPETPRAIYFNDDVYVGYCKGGDVLEISAADPKLGTVFYSLNQAREKPTALTRQADACFLCHASSRLGGFPGHLVRSVYPDPRGEPILSGGTHQIDHTSPLDKRWGGWYVTGTAGKQTHLGNLIIRTRSVPDDIDNRAGTNVTDLADRFNRTSYLNGHSDIVALLVLEHQAEGHNRLTRASFATRMALHHEAQLNREMKLPASHRWDSTNTRIRSACEALVQYLLFAGEARLTEQVRGSSTFADEFAKRGPRDEKGRSLRDFDLRKRLFKFPCSYLIYSHTFDQLPAEAREYVWKKLWEVLIGKDKSADFAHLSPEDRLAIREILIQTKAGLPAYWKAVDSESR